MRRITPRARSRGRTRSSPRSGSPLTSRWVQARMRPSIIASVTPRWRSAATILSPATPAPSGLKNTRLVSGSCTSTPVDLRQAAGERARIGVVVGEAIDVMVERVDAGGGADAGLPHRAAEALLPLPHRVDEGAACPRARRRSVRPGPWRNRSRPNPSPRSCRAAEMPLATVAFSRRAPSMWVTRPCCLGDRRRPRRAPPSSRSCRRRYWRSARR